MMFLTLQMKHESVCYEDIKAISLLHIINLPSTLQHQHLLKARFKSVSIRSTYFPLCPISNNTEDDNSTGHSVKK